MKLKIRKALVDGFKAVKTNPAILAAGFVYFLLGTSMQSYIENSALTINTSGFDAGYFISLYGFIMAINLIGIFLHGLMIVLSAKGKKFSVQSAMSLVTSKYVTMFLASIVATLFVSAVLVIVFIPSILVLSSIFPPRGPSDFTPMLLSLPILVPIMIFIGLKLAYLHQTILLNGKGPISSLKTSWNVTKSNLWGILALVLLTAVISTIIIIPFSIIDVMLKTPDFASIASFVYMTFMTPWIIASLTQSYLQLKRG